MAETKCFEISCSNADQNTFLHLLLANYGFKTSNTMKFKQDGSVLQP